jgi:hypothetical protein
MNNKIQWAFNILLTVILLIWGFSQFSSNKTLAADLSCSKIVQWRSVPTNSDLSNITIGLQY